MRIPGLALIALIFQITFWTATQAQIAAPRLNPLPFSVISSWNPAVYSWDGPSRIGGGISDATFDFTASGAATVEAATGYGKSEGIRLVGESFAFGADFFLLEMDIIAALGGGTIHLENIQAGAAFQLNEVFSLGLGQENGEENFSNDLSSTTLPLAGVTIRLGEAFYLGFAIGDETLAQETTTVPGSAVEGERGVTRIGMAYHSRNDENGLHLEVWREEVDAINSASFTKESVEATGFTLEVVFSNFLIGYETNSTEEISPVDGSLQEDEEGSTISLGWVPREGLAIVVSINDIEVYSPATNETIAFKITFAGVSWAF